MGLRNTPGNKFFVTRLRHSPKDDLIIFWGAVTHFYFIMSDGHRPTGVLTIENCDFHFPGV